MDTFMANDSSQGNKTKKKNLQRKKKRKVMQLLEAVPHKSHFSLLMTKAPNASNTNNSNKTKKNLQYKKLRKAMQLLEAVPNKSHSSLLVTKAPNAFSTIDSNNGFELRGLKKWIWEFHAKRPGSVILQKQVDDFIAKYEAGEEQARKVRETAAANDEGWTLVIHKGGRKKVTDSESGIKVGAVAASKAEKHSKEKASNEQTSLNFYRFQRREARRNEVLELQQRFEEDKKRIAKMKAARKFRPF